MPNKSSVNTIRAELPPLVIPEYDATQQPHPKYDASVRLAWQMKKDIEEIEWRYKHDLERIQYEYRQELIQKTETIARLEKQIAENRRVDLEDEIKKLRQLTDGNYTIRYILSDYEDSSRHEFVRNHIEGIWDLMKTMWKISNTPRTMAISHIKIELKE